MPANTPHGFPYPLPTEPVAEGAQAIRNLAEAVERSDATLAYVEKTSAVTVTTSATEAAPVLVLAAPALTFDGQTRIRITFACPFVDYADTLNAFWLLNLWVASPSQNLGRIAAGKTPVAGDLWTPLHAVRRLTPPAGTFTYSVQASQFTGGSTQFAAGPGGAAGQQAPMFLRIDSDGSPAYAEYLDEHDHEETERAWRELAG